MGYITFVPVDQIFRSNAVKLPNSKGYNKKRAYISGAVSTTTRIYVETVKNPDKRPTIRNPLKLGRFLPLQVKQDGDLNPTWVLVNINSLSKRSGISKKQIRTEYNKKNGAFEKLINDTLITSESDAAKKQERKKAQKAKKAKKLAREAKKKVKAEAKKAEKEAKKQAAKEAKRAAKVKKKEGDAGVKPVASMENPLDTSLILPDFPMDRSGRFGYASLPMEPPRIKKASTDSAVHSGKGKKPVKRKPSRNPSKEQSAQVNPDLLKSGMFDGEKFTPLSHDNPPSVAQSGKGDAKKSGKRKVSQPGEGAAKKAGNRKFAALNDKLPMDRSFMLDDEGKFIYIGKGQGT